MSHPAPPFVVSLLFLPAVHISWLQTLLQSFIDRSLDRHLSSSMFFWSFSSCFSEKPHIFVFSCIFGFPTTASVRSLQSFLPFSLTCLLGCNWESVAVWISDSLIPALAFLHCSAYQKISLFPFWWSQHQLAPKQYATLMKKEGWTKKHRQEPTFLNKYKRKCLLTEYILFFTFYYPISMWIHKKLPCYIHFLHKYKQFSQEHE